MAAVQPIVPATLARFSTEEEEIWFSNSSNLGDYMGPLHAVATPDVGSALDETPTLDATPTPTPDDTKWLETTMETLANGTPTIQNDVSSPNSEVQQIADTPNWFGITDFGIEAVTARPVTDDADENNDTVWKPEVSAQTPNSDAGICMADPIDFGFFPNFEDVEQESISEEEQKQEDLALDEEEAGAPQSKRIKQKKFSAEANPATETRKSGRTRRRSSRVVAQEDPVDTENQNKKTKKSGTRSKGRGRSLRGRSKNASKKASENTPAPKKKNVAPKRKNVARSKSKAGSPDDAETQKRKREERLRRNRESANRSRIRKKKEMLELKKNVVVLRETVNTLNIRIKELEKENKNLRGKLQSYGSQASPLKPVVTVFALVFAVTFFAQSSALPGTSLGTNVGGSRGKVLLSPVANPSKFKGTGFLLAPILDLFPDSAINSFLSSGFLPLMVDIVSKLFVAFLLAALCAACFYYWRTLRNSSSRKSEAVNGKAESEYISERHSFALVDDSDFV